MNNPGIAIKFYRLERWFYLHKMKICASIVFRFMQIFLGCTIPYTCDIEGGYKLHIITVLFLSINYLLEREQLSINMLHWAVIKASLVLQ